jgi:Phage Mu protein F like protein
VADLHIGFGTPWQAQIDFLLAKLRLPTERWDDIQKSAHDRAFIVAGAMKADLLSDIQQALIDNAGKNAYAFARDFKAIVAKHGWTGWTGEGTPEGEAWRARIIYQTNMRTSYMAARYQQLKANAEDLPYWKYVHSDGVRHPRPMHVSWDGLTLPHDHPFWNTHFPPNGWGCMCNVIGVSRRKGEAAAREGRGTPPAGWDAINPATGAPPGIDKGWGYAPGASVMKPMQSFIAKKLINLNTGIGAQMWQVLRPVVMAETEAAVASVVEGVGTSMQATGATVLIGAVDVATAQALLDKGVVLENAAIWLRDQEVLHSLRDAKNARGASLSADVIKSLPGQLADAEAYWDIKNKAVIYVFDLGDRLGKVAVKVNYNEKIRMDGERIGMVSNFVRTTGGVDPADMSDVTQYVRLN